MRTHAHEAKFTIGEKQAVIITLDRVKITSLKSYLSCEDLAERLVAVERDRDGVTSVELVSSVSLNEGMRYRIKFVSEGKRGRKVVDDVVEVFGVGGDGGWLVVAQGEDKVGEGEQVAKVLDGFVVSPIS